MLQHLGKDLIVFTKTETMQTIGLLSRTFLEDAGTAFARFFVSYNEPKHLHCYVKLTGFIGATVCLCRAFRHPRAAGEWKTLT